MTRRRHLIGISIVTAAALTPVVANADWDYIYGDPTGESVSGYRAAAFDREGGAVLVGHFTGEYDELSSPDAITMFVQRKSAQGSTMWTTAYPNVRSTEGFQPPEGGDEQFPLVLGENGNLSSEIHIAVATNNDVLVRACNDVCVDVTFDDDGDVLASEAVTGIDGYGRLASFVYPLGTGFVRAASIDGDTVLQKVNTDLTIEWSTPIEDLVTNGLDADLESMHHIAIGGELIWTVATIPGATAISRSSIALVQFNADGDIVKAIRHYGYEAVDFVTANRSFLWVNVTGPGSQDVPAGYGRYTVAFDAVDGSELGLVTGRQSYIVSEPGDDVVCTGFCEYYPVSGYDAGTTQQLAIYRGGDCYGCVETHFITMGGRRAITTTRMQTELGVLEEDYVLRIWDITGTTNLTFDLVGEVSLEDGFSSAIAVDAVGNILVAGATDDDVIFIDDDAGQTEVQASSVTAMAGADRAFTVLNPAGRLPLTVEANVPMEVQIAGRAGIPDSGAGAAAVAVTSVKPDATGFLTVYPCGERPNASNVNYDANDIVPNLVIAPLSDVGSVCIYSYVDAHLLLDVSGYFPAGEGFVPVSPVRLVDTRSSGRVGDGAGGGEPLRFSVTGRAGVPADGVGAVALNVTAVGTEAPSFGGFASVYPCGSLPNVSNLNFGSGDTVANAVVAPVSSSGDVCVFVYGSADVLVDISGYFPEGEGFISITPERLLDTR